MKTRWMTAAAAIALGLTALGAPAMAQPQGFQSQDKPMPDLSSLDKSLPPEPEARADGLRLQGRCPVAIPIYRALVDQGAGFDLAQFNLALCLYTVAKTQTDPAAASAMRQEAAQDTLTAANNGLPNAQSALVGIYLDGNGVAADPVEAGKWSLLYHDNQARRLYGLPAIAPALQGRLDTALNDAGWAQAQARANAWSPAPQSRFDR